MSEDRKKCGNCVGFTAEAFGSGFCRRIFEGQFVHSQDGVNNYVSGEDCCDEYYLRNPQARSVK